MPRAPVLSYFLCATPRSGSSLLCELLAATRVAAWPAEYFWRGDEAFWRRRWAISRDDDYVAAALRAGTAPYGVFGAKLMWDHMADLETKARTATATADEPLPELLARVFPGLRYVWVTRRDKLRQAISFVRALQTGAWARRAGDRIGEAEATFDAPRIARVQRELERDDRAWAEYFERAGIEPHRVVYEELATDVRGSTLAVLGYLGLDSACGLVLPSAAMRPQTDEVTEEWVARYLAEAGRRKMREPGR